MVNTSYEAKGAGCLRSGFEAAVNSTKRHEGSKYQGIHYVQTFLFKKGTCVAMSKECIVNMR
ncbi:MAG: hypothetical protein LBC35_01665 [Coriobacteriales bacterium]|nr:hypothetical protein [Coriobacteriales bacterium]